MEMEQRSLIKLRWEKELRLPANSGNQRLNHEKHETHEI